MSSIETVPATWTDADVAFFAITARVLSAQFCYGASILLAANDAPVDAPVPAPALPAFSMIMA